MRVIGHRGMPTGPLHPENTLSAIHRALEAGADGVEVDVRASSDGVLVLAHDPDLGRVLSGHTGTGPVVASTPYAALRAVRLPKGTHVPRLTDALDLIAAHRAHAVTEVKPDTGSRLRTAGLLASLLADRRRRHPGADRVTTSSFDPLAATTLAGYGSVAGAVIVEPYADPDPAAHHARTHGLTEIHLSVEHVHRDPTVVSRMHALRLTVAAGIVDDPEEVGRLARLGVDMVCTDAPDVVARTRLSAVATAG